MRKLFLFSGLISSILFQSCIKGGSDDGATQTLTVSLSKNSLRADGFDEVTITVLDANNTDVTASSKLKINGEYNASNSFHTLNPGIYKIVATLGNSQSGDVSLTALDPGNSPFTRKIYLEKFTHTECGYCPGKNVAVANYSNTHPNCITVDVHGHPGTSDPFMYEYISPLSQSLGVIGYPYVIVNRDYGWNGQDSVLDQELAKRAPLGIALETGITGNTINIRTKVKFDVSTSLPLKLIVMLVEDGLVHPQLNYNAPTYGPNPIPNYVHNNVLRKAATDILGDPLPVSDQLTGNTWEINHSINSSSFNISKCKIIAVVFYNLSGHDYTVLNAQSVTAGQNKAFD